MDQKRALKQLRAIKKYSNTTTMRLAAEEWDEEWKIIISTMMSAQTRDEVTIEIATKLFSKYPTPQKLANASVSDIARVISSINYYKTKAKHIQATAGLISSGGISYSVEELIKFPGVGRKTANVFLSEIGKKDAIAVDTHVFRISKKLGWANGNTPDKVEQDLMQLFPKKAWNSLNPTLVRFGKGYGTSRAQEDAILDTINQIM